MSPASPCRGAAFPLFFLLFCFLAAPLGAAPAIAGGKTGAGNAGAGPRVMAAGPVHRGFHRPHTRQGIRRGLHRPRAGLHRLKRMRPGNGYAPRPFIKQFRHKGRHHRRARSHFLYNTPVPYAGAVDVPLTVPDAEPDDAPVYAGPRQYRRVHRCTAPKIIVAGKIIRQPGPGPRLIYGSRNPCGSPVVERVRRGPKIIQLPAAGKRAKGAALTGPERRGTRNRYSRRGGIHSVK